MQRVVNIHANLSLSLGRVKILRVFLRPTKYHWGTVTKLLTVLIGKTEFKNPTDNCQWRSVIQMHSDRLLTEGSHCVQ